MPSNTGSVVSRYPKVLIPELNSGHLALLIRGRHLVNARSFSKVQGAPIWADDLEAAIRRLVDE
jgi:2-oxoglutarate/2-oxoacid ferredoxin oxidoreductase subunit alpha